MEMVRRKSPHYQRGDLVGDKYNEFGGNYHKHYMYCRKRLMILRINAATAIKRVVQARNSECLNLSRDLRSSSKAIMPSWVISNGLLGVKSSPSNNAISDTTVM